MASKPADAALNVPHVDFIQRATFRTAAKRTLEAARSAMTSEEFLAVQLRLGLDERSSDGASNSNAGDGGETGCSHGGDGGEESTRRGIPEVMRLMQQLSGADGACPGSEPPRKRTRKSAGKAVNITEHTVRQWIKTGLQKVPFRADYGEGNGDGSDAGALFRQSVLVNDAKLLVVNKLSGKRVTPFHRLASGSVVNSALAYLAEVAGEAGAAEAAQQECQAHPIHRLDVHTSGVLVMAKTREAAARYGDPTFWAEQTTKVYLAIVEGRPCPQGGGPPWLRGLPVGGSSHTDRELDGKCAMTRVTNLGASADQSRYLVQCELVRSGRRHQIRRHLAELGHPLVGDREYDGSRPRRQGAKPDANGDDDADADAGGAFFLHAASLALPGYGVIRAPVPERFRACLEEAGIALPPEFR